jgi:H+/Cl- antiporter ClcA
VSRMYRFLSKLERFQWNIALKSLLTGTLAGMLAVLYRLATERGTEAATLLYQYLKIHPVMICVWAAAAVGAGLLIAWLIRIEPMASGGGVPQVEGVILYGLKMRWYVVIAVRYIAGILGSLFGLSFGPEGPSIQLGAAVSEGVSNKIAETKIEKNHLLTSGAAAGLSAAFSAPLTGMIFALEEIQRSFSPTVLVSATTASLMADFISKYFFGLKPVLYFQNIPQLPLTQYLWLFPLGAFVGLCGVAMNRALLLFQTAYGKIPRKLRPIVALLLALPCGFLLPQVLGGGRNLIALTESANVTFSLIAVLLVVKIVYSGTSFGSGTPGGIFMPIISVGALSGCFFGLAAQKLGMPLAYLPVCVVCGIAGGLSSCVKAPVTSILLTAELTGSFLHILPVAICSFVALFVSDLLKTKPIYEALLHRYIEKNGYAIPAADKRGELIEFPVEAGSGLSRKLLREIDWPEGSLVVGLRRGSDELVPKGDTQILPGDYLLVLAPQSKSREVRKEIWKLCHFNI